MSIKGTLQTLKTNDYGFTAIKMGGAWYGGDKKGFKPDAQEGDLIEFEAFANAKGYQTYKSTSFKKVAASAPAAGNNTDGAVSGVSVPKQQYNSSGAAGSRDTYWADKATEDAKRDPRIVYQSSYERAIAFTSLAIQNGAFDALAKAKPTAKLSILESFVNEQADRILKQVYTAKVPTDVPTAKQVIETAGTTVELESDPEESWS